jgi:hypothetical protein
LSRFILKINKIKKAPLFFRMRLFYRRGIMEYCNYVLGFQDGMYYNLGYAKQEIMKIKL